MFLIAYKQYALKINYLTYKTTCEINSQVVLYFNDIIKGNLINMKNNNIYIIKTYTFLLLILLTLLTVTLSGYGKLPKTTNETDITSDETTTSEEGTTDYSKHSNLIKIEGSKDLYYYSDTKIITI